MTEQLKSAQDSRIGNGGVVDRIVPRALIKKLQLWNVELAEYQK